MSLNACAMRSARLSWWSLWGRRSPLCSYRPFSSPVQHPSEATQIKPAPLRWKDPDTQAQFLQQFSEKLSIQSPDDWYRVRRTDFQKHGGIGILKYYSSLFELLTRHFPEEKWDPLAFEWKPHGYWDERKNQRALFDRIAADYQIQSPEDWREIGYQQVSAYPGGRTLLRRFSSFVEALETIYPETTWDLGTTRKCRPSGYWDDVSNQRKQLDAIKARRGFRDHKDWRQLSSTEFSKEEGGSAILSKYPSYLDMLRTVYPEHEWDVFEDVPRVSRNFWQSVENQKAFLQRMSDDLQIKSLQDWKRVKVADFHARGGHQLLNLYGSVHGVLCALLPEYSWDDHHDFTNSRIPTGYFDSLENQRHFMDVVGEKLGVQSVEDWNSISREQVEQLNGGSLISRYPSFYDLLRAVYPEVDWDVRARKSVPRSYWKDVKNQRKLFDEIAAKYEITKPEEWVTVSHTQVIEEGGGRVLRYYKSFFEALQAIYPEQGFDALCVRSRVPNKYWDDLDNVTRFMNELKEKLRIRDDAEWLRVSIDQVQWAGGRTLMVKYGSLCNLLKLVYPDKPWREELFQNRKKRAAQRWMFKQVQQIFPDCEVIEEFLHPELSRISGKSVELDTFVPDHRLAFEFQGKHHYEECTPMGSLDMYQQRDAEKAQLCRDNNVSLVAVPYWWDYSEESLRDLIQQQTSLQFDA